MTTKKEKGTKTEDLPAIALRKCLANPVTRSALAKAMMPIFERAIDAVREEAAQVAKTKTRTDGPMTPKMKAALRFLIENGGTDEGRCCIGQPTRMRLVKYELAKWVSDKPPKYPWDDCKLELTEKGQGVASSLIKVTKHKLPMENM